jgi:hypothetical protein
MKGWPSSSKPFLKTFFSQVSVLCVRRALACYQWLFLSALSDEGLRSVFFSNAPLDLNEGDIQQQLMQQQLGM